MIPPDQLHYLALISFCFIWRDAAKRGHERFLLAGSLSPRASFSSRLPAARCHESRLPAGLKRAPPSSLPGKGRSGRLAVPRPGQAIKKSINLWPDRGYWRWPAGPHKYWLRRDFFCLLICNQLKKYREQPWRGADRQQPKG